MKKIGLIIIAAVLIYVLIQNSSELEKDIRRQYLSNSFHGEIKAKFRNEKQHMYRSLLLLSSDSTRLDTITVEMPNSMRFYKSLDTGMILTKSRGDSCIVATGADTIQYCW
ncbi:hypothetical protein [Phaeocystidibacter marisrubri]|uniref:Uncharacterized protein n=1 Tax=Phaeocystidibacter marisrubri TaxID=1577780 RepID=A0A6L3ZFX8_9FLAO|nr:hypothetical protein [Phaeocystidibacter marisrubri]KAB2816603.1 hypothetical protein F8C82_13050 [Phaeocystidibacter marisrubri]GGH69888.1 hypothetical protein GCM10011318_11380 [Phaeocystidibacter marisrubri]